ncbi:malto-oligosyltrehalose synthase [Ilumatobacter nonamiensis]|uniref:malto-oligosyltrehalose synthase n=1 Tax=Ilumatobacter nonamiensis TaxID=467093 RepID=UPI000345AE01|nr:malto-oligosyltrehalose synthase [Ilumatobacter nonamiensis]
MATDRRLAPTASYRLQLTPEFGFDEARAQLDTIASLGVSHLYLSPIAQAVPSSLHGYDVTDHSTVRREFGGDSALERLLDAAADRAMGVIIDHVPNHVSVERAEFKDPWWTMLRDGPTSEAARWFDVDWEYGGRRVIIPRLGSTLDEVLAADGIEIGVGDRGPELRYGPLRFPLAPGTESLPVHEAVHRQHYTLQWWRDPARNVRRFFTIDDLVAVRVEHDDVAARVDTIPRRLVDHAAFAGVRVDHVDGLADPTGYLAGLRDAIGDRLLFVEKILGPAETLPRSWPVEGTTGYENITAVEHALVDPSAEQPLTALWESWVDDIDFHTLEDTARREVLGDGLAPDLDRLVREITDGAVDVAEVRSAREVVVEMTVALDRYRTYLPGDAASRPELERAVSHAREQCPSAAVDRVVDVLAGSVLERWQQLTGPVMAKGAEDRAFYRYLPLASFSEVGGSPGRFAVPLADFHRFQADRQRRAPEGMVAATTHDTKRSQGVRARSLALAARAPRWVTVVSEWAVGRSALLDGIDRRLVLLALQTAVTARPLTAERLSDYLVKSAREADQVTSWTEPDSHVESALGALATALVAESNDPASPLAEFASAVEAHGASIDLALLAVQLTSPGFADLYQGSPAGLFSLVDPDNRHPPDWGGLHELVELAPTSDVATAMGSGRVDLARVILTQRILRLRARRPEAFGADASYTEVVVSGPGATDVLAYVRSDAEGPVVLVVTTRALGEPVDGASITVATPAGTWGSLLHDDAPVLATDTVRLADLLGDLGLAVLERTDR